MDENEQKQQLSFAYLHAVASAAGYSCYLPFVDDDSIDRALAARGKVQGLLQSPRIDVQLKSQVRNPLKEKEQAFTYRLKKKNYDDLRGVQMVPRLLVVLLLPRDPNAWVEVGHEQMVSRYAAYYLSLSGMPGKGNASTVTVTLLRHSLFSVANLRRLMEQASQGKRKLQ
jgi:hypothetical protein